MANGLITYQELGEDLKTKIDELNITQSNLSQDYKSIFSSGTGKDSNNIEQDYNNVAEGQSSIKLEGLTVQNLVVNGDFSNGTTGWVSSGTNGFTVSNNIMSFTINQAYGNAAQLIPLISNNIYYCATMLKSTSNLVRLNVQRQSSYDTLVASHSGSGKFERLSVFGDILTTSSTSRVAIMDFSSSGWDEISFTNCMLINLTALGLATLTKEQCDYMFDHYFNGLQGIGSGKIVSVGKNLFNALSLSLNTINANVLLSLKDSNTIVVENKAQVFGVYGQEKIKVKPNTDYYFNYFLTHISGSNIYEMEIHAEDNITTLKTGYGIFNSGTSNYIWVRVYQYNIGKNEVKIQIEEGTIATDYEPYQSSELITTLPQQLHRLPNGVSDTVEEVNGVKQVTYRTKEYVLQASDITSINNTATNLTTALITKPSGFLQNTVGSYILKGFPYLSFVDSLNNLSTTYEITSAIVVTFAKGTTLEQAQTALAGTKIIYQLATPVTYKNGENGFMHNGNIEAYPYGTIYQEPVTSKESCNVKTYIHYNLSDKDMIIQSSGSITAINKRISNWKTIDPWIAPTLLNGWVNFNIANETVGYYKDDFGIVHLKGVVKSGTITTSIFILPEGYRPSLVKVFSTISNDAAGRIDINNSGSVVSAVGSNIYLILDGISFRAVN